MTIRLKCISNMIENVSRFTNIHWTLTSVSVFLLFIFFLFCLVKHDHYPTPKEKWSHNPVNECTVVTFFFVVVACTCFRYISVIITIRAKIGFVLLLLLFSSPPPFVVHLTNSNLVSKRHFGENVEKKVIPVWFNWIINPITPFVISIKTFVAVLWRNLELGGRGGTVPFGSFLSAPFGGI